MHTPPFATLLQITHTASMKSSRADSRRHTRAYQPDVADCATSPPGALHPQIGLDTRLARLDPTLPQAPKIKADPWSFAPANGEFAYAGQFIG